MAKSVYKWNSYGFWYLSKEVWKLNFRQYGQVETHSQEEAQTWRRSEGWRSKVGKISDGESQKREDAGARKGKKVAKHCVFLLFCGKDGTNKWHEGRNARVKGPRTPQMWGEPKGGWGKPMERVSVSNRLMKILYNYYLRPTNHYSIF